LGPPIQCLGEVKPYGSPIVRGALWFIAHFRCPEIHYVARANPPVGPQCPPSRHFQDIPFRPPMPALIKRKRLSHAVSRAESGTNVIAFISAYNASPLGQRFVESTRDLMMSNSTKGFEGLAEEFAMAADKVDPAAVEGALYEAGIKFSRMSGGSVLLDLTSQGLGQMTFKQAVSLGYIKLSRNT
jgi:hypothetical protein